MRDAMSSPYSRAAEIAEAAEAARARERDLLAELEDLTDSTHPGSRPRHIRFEHGERHDLTAQRAAGRAACFAVRARMGLPIPPPLPARSANAIYASADWLYG